jgi:hypothetical protein
VSISVVKCIWVKCSEVLQCSDGLSNKMSNIIRRHTDNMKFLLIIFCYYHILSYFLCSISFIDVCIVAFLFNTVIYVFLLLCLYILIVCLCIFIVPAGSLRLP